MTIIHLHDIFKSLIQKINNIFIIFPSSDLKKFNKPEIKCKLDSILISLKELENINATCYTDECNLKKKITKITMLKLTNIFQKSSTNFLEFILKEQIKEQNIINNPSLKEKKNLSQIIDTNFLENINSYMKAYALGCHLTIHIRGYIIDCKVMDLRSPTFHSDAEYQLKELDFLLTNIGICLLNQTSKINSLNLEYYKSYVYSKFLFQFYFDITDELIQSNFIIFDYEKHSKEQSNGYTETFKLKKLLNEQKPIYIHNLLKKKIFLKNKFSKI